jgi:hypothetical protein
MAWPGCPTARSCASCATGMALAVRPSAAAAWRGEMAIRLYRDAGHTRPVVMALWSYLANREAPGLHADR